MLRRSFVIAILLLLVGCVPVRVPGEKIGKAPFKSDTPAMLVVYESGDLSKMPTSQKAMLASVPLRQWFKSRSIDFRFYDKDALLEGDSPWVREAMAVPSEHLPRVLYAHGKRGFVAPLPADEAKLMAMVPAPARRRK